MPDEHARPPLVIDVWSDVMCPFCYMGDALLQKALESFAHADAVEVRYHSYQLMPHLPADCAMNVNDLLVREKGLPRARAEELNAQITERGKQVGLDYRFDKAIAVNTRAAHRLSHFAKQHGKQLVLMRRVFRAFFTEGLDLGKHEVLAGLAADVGLERAAALDALASNAFEEDVRADVNGARAIGIQGVPFFVLDGKFAVSGAQPVPIFTKALEAAWTAKLGAA
ncbi:MAG: DsbA family oxidoreductase [Kofleriaceae bacterium]|nr:DsbA family oxidoreductase [Kofleriaceae bacterium]